MKSLKSLYSGCATGLLVALLGLTPQHSFAATEREENDDATARRQAMDEWYNESYDNRDKKGLHASQKRPLWTPQFERFMHDAAKRERERYARQMPASGTSTPVVDSIAPAIVSGTAWTNIGPTKANYEENGGTSLNVSDSGRVNAIVTEPANTNVIYLGFSGGGVWKSLDGGSTWAAKTETLGSLSVGSLEMDPNNANTLYLGLGDSFDGTGLGMVKSTNGGDTWSAPVFLGDSTVIPNIKVAPANSSIVLAATNSGLYRSTDGGASFSLVTIATGASGKPYVWTIAWAGGNNFVLSLEATHTATTGTTGGQIWRSADNGATWTQATGVTDTLGVGRISVAAAPSLRTTLYATAAVPNPADANDLANFFKSTDGGATWTGIAKTGTTYKSYSNTNSESSTLKTLLNGQGWYNHMTLVDPSNANIAYFGGALLMAKTSDGGTTYKQSTNWLAQFSLPYVHADFHAGHFASNGTLYVGTDGGIFRSTDNAATFTATLNQGIASHLVYQVGSSLNNRDAVVVGLQDNGTRVRVTNSSVFNQEIGGDGFGCDVNQSNANQMLGSLYYSRPYKSTDGGVNFSQACSGITECNNSSTGVFTTRIIRSAADTTGNTVFTFSNTKVYKSTNYATSWTALGTSGLPTSNLFLRQFGIAKSNTSVMGLVANSGQVFLSSNGGTSWAAPATALPNNGFSLSFISFDPTNSNTVYVTSVAPDSTKNHAWKSTNFGASWTAIDAGGFPTGIPVNQVTVDPQSNTTLFAATHLGVYRSNDSGATWTRFGTGLPLVNTTDLYVAADDSLVRAATFGRSVWELSPGASNTPPVANFSFSTSTLTATFTDGSSDSDGTVASRSWNFGDSTTSTATNPSHTYTAAGTYSVTLTVTDNGGATNAVTKSVSVSAANTPPVANFTFTTNALTATFTDSSTDSDGTIASRSWNFGDSTTSTTTNPSHTYAAAGTYNVALTVTDNSGGTNTVTKAVTATAPANVPPVANFTFTTSALTANFTDTSTDSDGTIASRSWNFGDSTTSTTTSPSHTYAAAGTFSVVLTVTDNGGATNSKTQSVTVSNSGTVLSKGVTVTGLAATTGNAVNYTMVIPAGATNLTFTMSGGTGDADMYVKFGAAPTDTVYDCRPFKSGNAESCTFAAPSAGTYFVRLKAYASFTAVSLVGDYTVSTGGTQTYTNTTATPIPDVSTINSTIAVSGRTGNAPAASQVAVNITHTYRGDLKIDLVAPDGSVYALKASSSSDGADNVVATYTANLSTEALNGTWTLRVQDVASGDTGTLNSWSITF